MSEYGNPLEGKCPARIAEFAAEVKINKLAEMGDTMRLERLTIYIQQKYFDAVRNNIISEV